MDEPLHNLQPVASLNAENLQLLASKLKSDELVPGTHIRAADEHRSLIYVVRGSVEILQNEEVKETIKADTRRAQYPIFLNHANEAIAKIRTMSKVIRLEKELYNVLKQQQQDSSVEISDVQLNEEESEIFNAIYQNLISNKLVIASLSGRVEQLRNALSRPDLDVQEMVRLIQSDPVIAAKLIRTVSEPEYRAQYAFDSIQYAVESLGVEKVRELVDDIIGEQDFEFKFHYYKEKMRRLYKHSIYMSLISSVIAKTATKIDPHKALFASLVHDIGVVPILTYLDEHNYAKLTDESLGRLIMNLRSTLGELILQRWGYDEELVTAAAEAKNWNRELNDTVDCCDILVNAQILSRYASCYSIPLPRREDVSSCVKLKSLDGESVLTEAKNAIKTMKSLMEPTPRYR